MKQTTGAPLVLILKAALMTLIMTTLRGRGMKPIRRETASHWSAKACREKNHVLLTQFKKKRQDHSRHYYVNTSWSDPIIILKPSK